MVYQLKKSKSFSPSDPEYSMGPLSRTDERRLREYLRARFMACFGPEDLVLDWSIDHLLEDVWMLRFYCYDDLVFIESLPTLKIQLYDDDTMKQKSAEFQRECERDRGKVTFKNISFMVTEDSVKSLSHWLETIESYRPGLGKRLGEVVQELLTEPTAAER